MIDFDIYATGGSGTIGKYLSNRVTSLQVDLSDRNFDLRMDKNAKLKSLIHLAGIVGNNRVQEDQEYSFRVNVQSTRILAEKFLEYGGDKFIYVSSSHVYAPQDYPLDENSNLEPRNLYASQKLAAELELHKVFGGAQDKLCIVRVFSVLNWGTHPFTLGGAIMNLAKDKTDYKLNYGDDIRDFLTPSTIANTLEEMSTRLDLEGVFNLCSGFGISISKAATRMLDESGFQVGKDRINGGHSEVPYLVGNNSKLKAKIPNVSLEWTPSRIQVGK